jgi:hypothetical protein
MANQCDDIMEWFWVLQIAIDGMFTVALWKLLRRKPEPSAPPEPREVDSGLSREDFEHYQAALGDLCERMNREAEQWLNRLEQKTRAARQTIYQVQTRSAIAREERLMAPSPKGESIDPPAPVPGPGTVRQEVEYLRSQGYTPEQIARRLKIGQREVQLFLSVQPRR